MYWNCGLLLLHLCMKKDEYTYFKQIEIPKDIKEGLKLQAKAQGFGLPKNMIEQMIIKSYKEWLWNKDIKD